MKITTTAALALVGNLTPVWDGNVRGIPCWVLTGTYELPAHLQAGQRDRTEAYLATGARNAPTYAPRFVVTSYGAPIAWLLLDGSVHYATAHDLSAAATAQIGDQGARSTGTYLAAHTARFRTLVRHQAAIRAAWADRFVIDSQGDPATIRHTSGYSYVEAAEVEIGAVKRDDAGRWYRVQLPAGTEVLVANVTRAVIVQADDTGAIVRELDDDSEGWQPYSNLTAA